MKLQKICAKYTQMCTRLGKGSINANMFPVAESLTTPKKDSEPLT